MVKCGLILIYPSYPLMEILTAGNKVFLGLSKICCEWLAQLKTPTAITLLSLQYNIVCYTLHSTYFA